MQKRLLLVVLISFAALSSNARAASIAVNGVAGAPGADGVDGLGFLPPGEPGGAGGDADALANSPDATNTATATGGNGGAGGNGGDSTGYGPGDFISVGGYGGTGGAGGAALANAITSTASEAAQASATSTGGTGGAGGLPGEGLDADGLDGSEGVGGGAEANAIAASSGGSATAESAANGGLGGKGGEALATSDATSLASSANATAVARGGTSGCCTTHLGSALQGLEGGRAEAHASAATDGSADAVASAEAFGGGAAWGLGAPANASGGEAIATATATSLQGNATAVARQTAGDGSPGSVGALVSGPIHPGGPGASSTMIDAVNGGAGGVLTLVQEARGGGGGLGAIGGAARSDLLLAENLLGGELFAAARAVGGSFQTAVHDLVSGPPLSVSSPGGAATATVVATDTHGARVEGHGSAEGGRGNVSWDGIAAVGGEALSNATARGLGEVLARADATTHSAPHANAQSRAETVGRIVGARSTLDLLATPHPQLRYQHWTRRIETESGIEVGASADGAALPPIGEGHARIFAAPRGVDVAAWTAGNSNATAALAGAEVLALGSLGASSDFYGDLGATSGDAPHLTGSLAIELDGASFGGSTALSLAFLDPAALGAGIDFLHLRFSVDGVDVFDASFEDTASALAGLDDALVELGALGESADPVRTLLLAIDLDFAEAAEDAAFAFDFALLAKAVPEPAAALLLACFGAALLAVRRARLV